MIRRALALTLLAFICLVTVGAAQFQEEGHARLVLADGLFARDMYSLAAQEYEAILREEPDLGEADVVHYRLGECYRHMGKSLDADKQFGIVFKKYPQSKLRHRAGFRRAGLFLDGGYYDAAVDLYHAVLKENPPPDIEAACWYLLGEALLKLDRDQDAVAAFDKVVKQFPQSEFHAYAMLKLGQTLAQGDDKQGQIRARKLFEQVAENPPDARLGAEGLFQAAESLYRAGEFKQSAAMYQKLAKTYPADTRTTESRLRAAWAHHNASLYADALRLCETIPAKEQGSDAAEWLYLKANCLRQLLRYSDAATAYRELLKVYSQCRFAEAAQYELALALYNDGKYKAAVAEAKGLATDADLQKDVYWLLAESYAALGQADDAVQYYRLIARDFPDSDEACEATYRLGYHLQSRGSFVEAAEQFGQAASRWPDHDLVPKALFAAGYCWSQAGNDEKAVAAWSTLLQKHANDSLAEEALYQKAMSEIRLKRDSDALASLRDLRRRFVNSSYTVESAYWEGRLLQQAQKYADAETSLRLVLSSRARPDLKREAELALAYVLQAQDKNQEAADRFQNIVGTPDESQLSASLLEWLAQYQLEQQAYAKSIAAAKPLTTDTREQKRRQSGWMLLGRAYAGQGETNQAVKAYEKVLALDGAEPVVAEAALELGDAALRARQWKKAAEYFDQAAARAGAAIGVRARAYSGQGRAARARGNFDQAARYFMSVAILYDDPVLVPDCLAQAAACLKAVGDVDGAAKALAERKNRYPDLPPPAE